MTGEANWPDPNDGEKPDIQLDANHSLTWSRYEGEIVGAIVRHASFNERGYCEAIAWLRGNAFSAKYKPNGPVWDMAGTFENPTLTPSLNCHCGESHGWIRDGKWVDA